METAATRPDTSPAMQAQPQQEHQWLEQLVGEWTYEAEMPATPGHAASKQTGTESVRSLGGLWVLLEGRGEMPDGGPATTLMTLGYDPQRQRFVGTWIGSMMSHLWLYDGELDSAKKVLTLGSEGPSMTDTGKMAKYRDVVEIRSRDHRVLTAHALREDGKWQQFMTVNYRRKA